METKDIETFFGNNKYTEQEKKRIIYQFKFDQLTNPNLKLNKSEILWNHKCFYDIAKLIKEQDEYITNPYTVEDGVTQCKKCSSRKVWSIQKQTRSADEPMTTISKCTNCGAEWTYSG
mgnify:CR=1 FL=1